MSAVSATDTSTSQQIYDSLNQKNTTTTSSASSQQSKFLTLLTTQLKNQDPTNPMDNAQMTSQLAQISTVDGIERLNQTLSTMATQTKSSDTLQAASLVGRSVLVAGDQIQLTKGMAVGGVQYDKAASKSYVSIMDSTGKEVDRVDMGAKDAGVYDFVWDGKTSDGTTLADGQYTMKVVATDKDGAKVSANTLELATVGYLVTDGGNLKIDVGRLGRVTMNDIKLIL